LIGDPVVTGGSSGRGARAEAPIDERDGPRSLADCERELRRAGLPLLIEEYSASEDIFTRAVPFFVFVALAEVSGAVNLTWSIAANLFAVAAATVLLVVGFGVFNAVRGRPFFTRPDRIGVVELAAFVLLPALLPLIFGGQAVSALFTALANLVLVGLAWLVVGFGLVSVVRWAGARLFSQLATSLTVLVRALPLILFFGLLAFFTAEIWQLFNTVPTSRFVAAVVLFVVLGTLFLIVRVPQGTQDVEAAVELAGVPLRPAQRLNVALVIIVSQALQILLVTMLVWLFFATFGALLVDVDVIAEWTGEQPQILFRIPFIDDVVVTRQLLRAAFGIAAFSGLYYAVAMLVDATYRDEFVGELKEKLRSTFLIRAEYLELRGVAGAEEAVVDVEPERPLLEGGRR
jgi:hypothetical protein